MSIIYTWEFFFLAFKGGCARVFAHPHTLYFIFNFLIEVQLTYYIVLISGVEKSDFFADYIPL